MTSRQEVHSADSSGNGVLAMTTAKPGTTPCEKSFIFYPQVSQLCRSVQYACRFKNLVGLNM